MIWLEYFLIITGCVGGVLLSLGIYYDVVEVVKYRKDQRKKELLNLLKIESQNKISILG